MVSHTANMTNASFDDGFERNRRERIEMQQPFRLRFSFKNATIFVCLLNIVTVLFLLHSFFGRSTSSTNPSDAARLKYIKECEEIRLAMQPLELIKRVREIQQEVYAEPEAVVQKGVKHTAAVDLSKRLKDFHTLNDAASLKALEEWRKRKMERARQRERGKDGTSL